MSYIGRGVDAISNVEKLDNITFNGGTTYSLTKSSAAFTPVGANNILISIDGVIQQGNFSVSTTNVVFDFSPTSSNTCDFILNYGTGVLNVPADGSVSAEKMAANSVDSDSYVDGSIDAVHLSANSVDSDAYVDGSIDLAHMSSESVDEDNLHISNAGTNGQFLSKQSGNSGGLTWADAGGAADNYFASSGLSSKDLGAGLHIKVSDTGASVDATADGVVIEDNTAGGGGLSILSPTNDYGTIAFGDSGDNNIGKISYNHTDNSMRLSANASERVRITSGGKVGIGEEVPLCNDGGLHIKTGDSGQGSVSAGAAELVVESATNAGLSFLSSTSGNGSIHFGDSGGDTRARIVYRHADDSMALETGHTEGNVEIFRMHNYGMLIGRTDFVSGVNAIVQVNADKKASGGGGFLAITSVTGAANLYHCHNGNGHVGGISTSGTSTSFNTTSDYRLKENETSITDGITRIKQLKPYKFNFKADTDTILDGFFAHEVSDVVPEAIMGEKDAMIPEILYTAEDELPEGKNIGDVKEATKIDPQGIDQAKLVPLLTSALQEAITKIETLEAKVVVLEG